MRDILYSIGWLIVSLYLCFVSYMFSQPGLHMPVVLIFAVWFLMLGSSLMTGVHSHKVWMANFKDEAEFRRAARQLHKAQRRRARHIG